ncbi:hypothetical protein IF650_09275 [Cellulosimicrobium terreum]|nr:hypothetical protein [Cellulosimicrobium terreum]
MRRPSLTDVLVATTVLLALGAALAFAVSATPVAGTLIALAIALAAVLVRSVARDLGRRQSAMAADVAKVAASARRLERESGQLLVQSDLIVRSNRRVIRATVVQADRVEERTDAMTRRILGDLSAARLEAADRQDPPSP